MVIDISIVSIKSMHFPHMWYHTFIKKNHLPAIKQGRTSNVQYNNFISNEPFRQGRWPSSNEKPSFVATDHGTRNSTTFKLYSSKRYAM